MCMCSLCDKLVDLVLFVVLSDFKQNSKTTPMGNFYEKTNKNKNKKNHIYMIISI